MDDALARRIAQLLAEDEAGRATTRFVEDGRRLFTRVKSLATAIGVTVHADELSLACSAWQLPLRARQPLAVGRFGQINLRERAERAVEELVRLITKSPSAALIDRACELLIEVPNRRTRDPDAQLLADAINLDDFGVTGLFNAAIVTGRQNHGLETLIEGFAKRDAYGYWQARLRDSFHTDHARNLATRRLGSARRTLAAIEAERAEDGAA